MRIWKTIRNYLFDLLGRTVFSSSIILRILRKKYFGLDMIDKRLAQIITHKNGFYVELGANDGNSQSNTKYFEVYRGWNGLLVEPVPHVYEKLLRNRSKRNYFRNCACGSFAGPRQISMLYSGLMTTTLGDFAEVERYSKLAFRGEEHLSWRDKVYEIRVEVAPLNELLLEVNAPPSIDLLSLDVEGYEIEVLSGINHDKFRFKFILVETENFETLSDYLNKHNYNFIEQLSFHDYLFSDSL